MLGYVALVLHGHLPYAAEDEDADRIAYRWLLEAIWESYLPLLEGLERLARDDIAAPITWSVSPPLASMLRGPALEARMAHHLATLVKLNDGQRQRAGDGSLAAATAFYAQRLASAQESWASRHGDLLGGLDRLRRAERLELLTSSATHAFLPGLTPIPEAIGAQLRVGARSFEKLVGHRAEGIWLPECGFDRALAPALTGAGYGYTVLDAHSLELGQPRPLCGATRPVVDPSGLALFGRDRGSAAQVWSRALGYPGDPAYRDFYRDLGFDQPDDALEGLGAGNMTGLKYHRITGRGPLKRPYDPAAAQARVETHAEHFVASCAARLASMPRAQEPPIVVAAYDAELFGHWWFEGPAFVEQVLRRLARSTELEATSLGGYLRAHRHAAVVRPASSSWGQGGYGQVWVGPKTAALWRHVHRAHREVRAALRTGGDATGPWGAALDQAIIELLLLQASDWAFMIHQGDVAAYANERVQRHAARVQQLLRAVQDRCASPEDQRTVAALRRPNGFLRELDSEVLRRAFAP